MFVNLCVHILLPDVDECLTASSPFVCDLTNGRCHNTAGSYYCTCDSGYTLLGTDCHSKYIPNCDKAEH